MCQVSLVFSFQTFDPDSDFLLSGAAIGQKIVPHSSKVQPAESANYNSALQSPGHLSRRIVQGKTIGTGSVFVAIVRTFPYTGHWCNAQKKQ